MFLSCFFALLPFLLLVRAVEKNPKRGISFPADNNVEDVLNFNQSSSVISWVYDWASTPPTYLQDTGIEYVPMQWGAGGIESLASRMENSGLKTLLAFNEPDFDEQSNMNATHAAELWKEYIEPLKATSVRLGAPAVTSADKGRVWLQAFFDACSGCSIDFLPLHWYGEGLDGFYDYLWTIHGLWPDYSLWVTEYGDEQMSYDDVLQFMNASATYMDELDWVERYAWFGYFRPEEGFSYNMLEEDGGLNELGEFYIGATAVAHSGPATQTAGAPGSYPTDSAHGIALGRRHVVLGVVLAAILCS